MLNQKQWFDKQHENGHKTLVVYYALTWKHVNKQCLTSFLEMTSPEVQDELLEKYNVKLTTFSKVIFPLDLNANTHLEKFVSEFQADYIMCADSDQVFQKNTILKLFESLSDEFPVVTGIYFRKSPPHACTIGYFSPWTKFLEGIKGTLQEQGLIGPEGQQLLYYRPMQSYDVVRQVDVFGLGVVMFDAKVFKQIEQPYLKYINGYGIGDHSITSASEDIWLAVQFKKKGIKVLCNPKIVAGHISEKVIISPEVDLE